MRGHVTFLGWLHVVIGALELLAALAVLGVFGLVGGAGLLAGDPFAGGLAAVIGGVIALLVVVTALPNVIAGIGLLMHAGWGRWVAIAIAVFNLLKFPWGTALGVYTFLVLFDDEVKVLFRGERAYP